MMFEDFQRSFPRDPWIRTNGRESAVVPAIKGLREFFEAFGGASFGDGLYRVIHPADLNVWKERIHLAFPEFANRVVCFGYDWIGTVFALDPERRERGQPGVLMFEPGTGEALEVPSNIQTFHGPDLKKFSEAAFAMSFYDKWRASKGAAPLYDECVGYQKPLFLGGADDVSNLEVSDLDVYWHLTGQLIAQTRGLPEGARVRINVE